MTRSFKAEVQQLLFNNSTASGSCREALAQKIADLRAEMGDPIPLMDVDKFEKLSGNLFMSAAGHAEAEEVDFVGSDPDQWFKIHGQYAAFEAAVEYFDNCDFKYATS